MTDATRYPIPAAEHRVEHTVQRSRFVATIAHAATPEDASEFIRRVGHEFADATHNCWAYVVGRPGSTDRIGLSDDGEPHGTAGRPMLNALLHGGVGDVAVVVTRYYGGTKLGTGGLVRAYGGAVRQALETLPLAERIDYAYVRFTIAYASVSAVQSLAPDFEVEELDRTYAAEVSFLVRLPAPNLERFTTAVLDATRGQATISADPTTA